MVCPHFLKKGEKYMVLYILLGLLLVLIVVRILKGGKRQDIISVYFGVPGCGKTTFATYLARRDIKHKSKVWSNVPITGTYKLDCNADLGKRMICNGRIIIDEASVEYNNRNFKAMPQHVIKFFKYHRHYQTAIDVFSQSWDDMDITIRRLAQKLYVLKKSIFPFFIVRRTLGKRIGVDENTKQIIDEYYFVPFSRKYIFCPVLWKYFNTLSRDELPEKEWEMW